MEPILIFKSAAVLQSIAAYFGLIESVSTDVKKLLHQSFVSATDLLRFAQNSEGDVQKKYIQDAMLKFTEAKAVEESENLISAYLGLSMCQYFLGDFANAQLTFGKIRDVELKRSEKIKDELGRALLIAIPGSIGIPQLGDELSKIWLNREDKFNEYKQKVLKIVIHEIP